MESLKVEEVLNGLADLAEMVEPGYLTSENIKQFHAFLSQGCTIKQAQDQVIYNTTI